MARGATLATRWLQRLQPISNRPVGLGFPHRAGRYQPGNISVTAPGCKRCRGYERFLTRGREPILPGCGMTAALARDVILATRWLQKPQPISNRPVDLGFPHAAGRYHRGRSAFTCPDSWSCRYYKGFKTRGWELTLFRCGGTAALARDVILATRWLQKPQPISNRPVELGFPHPAGRYRPGGSTFTTPGCWSCRDMDGCLTRG